MNTNTTRRRRLLRSGALAVGGLALLAACGDDDSNGRADSAPAATAAAAPAAASPTTAAASSGGYDYDYGGGSGSGSEATPAPAAAPGSSSVATAETSLGTVLVDADGMTLYAFTKDTAGEPTCTGGCADAWPPALVEGELSVGDLDASLFSTVENPAGGTQMKAGDFPLYRFAGDGAPGDVSGQGSGGNWFVVAPDGSLIRS